MNWRRGMVELPFAAFTREALSPLDEIVAMVDAEIGTHDASVE